MHKFKRVIALLMALTMAVFCIPLSGLEAFAASLTPGQTNQTVVTCFYAQTGENMPRRQYGASSLLTNTIRDVEGKGICMLFVEADGASIADLGVGSSLTTDKIKKTNGGKNMWAYCIQHGNSAGDGGGYTVTAENVDAFFMGLSNDARTGIKATLLVGFPTSNFGYAACDAYAATQAVIWEFQTGIRTIKKNSDGTYNGTTLSSSRETQNFGSTTMAAYNALVTQVNSFLTDPSIRNQTITLKWNASNNRYEGVVTDTKNVISNYYLKTTGTGINASTSGNKLTLYTTNPALKNVNLTFEHSVVNASNKSDQTLMVLEHATQQKIAVGTASDPLTMPLRASVEDVGNLTITKNTQYGNGSNYGGDLSGWKFTVEGYAGSTKVSTNNVTTGSNGKATLNNLPLYSGTTLISYRITETGNTNASIQNKYLWNGTGTVSTTLTAPTSSGISTTNVNYANKLKMGKIELTKYYENDGENYIEEGAVFEVYINTASSYTAANANWKDTITTGSNGRAITKDLPYGTYIVHQIVAKEGTRLHADFTVSITENGQIATPSQQIVNREIKSYIKVIKKDAETGNTIPLAGAEFEIYDSEQNLLTFRVWNGSQHENISTLTTNDEGILVTPDYLKYGDYYLKEIKAPEGYVLDDTLVPFSVTANTYSGLIGTVTYSDLIDVTKANTVQKGIIKIYKEGLGFSSVTNETDGTYTPVYANTGLQGAVFEVKAAEDISTPDGTLQYTEGQVVATITTGADGYAQTGELYIGNYVVSEKTAPVGYVLNDTPYNVEIQYEGQEIDITETTQAIGNNRQTAEFKLIKTMQMDETFGIGGNGEVGNAVFGIYAKTELVALDGSSIPANGLIEVISADANGNVTVTKDLPIGSYYFKEISTDAHYVLVSTEFDVRFDYQGQTVEKAIIFGNDREAVLNELKYGKITFNKVDEDGVVVEGVVFGLYREDDTSFAEPIITATTNAEGIAIFDKVPYGNWIIKEISTLPQYVLDETPYPVSIIEDEQTEEQLVINKYVRGTVHVTKVDAEFSGNKLSGAVFEVYEAIPEGGEPTTEEVENKVVIIPAIDVYPFTTDKLFIVGHAEQALDVGTNTMYDTTHEIPYLTHDSQGMDTLDPELLSILSKYIDTNAMFGLGIDALEYGVSRFVTSADDDYDSYVISVTDIWEDSGALALFEQNYDFLIVKLSDGTVYKEKLIMLDTTNNAEHQALADAFGLQNGDVLSQSAYDRYVYMKEANDKLTEDVASGAIDPATLTLEEQIDLTYNMMYGGIKKGIQFLASKDANDRISSNFMFMVYDPDRAGVVGDVKLDACLSKKDEFNPNTFYVVSSPEGSASLFSLWQGTDDTTYYDNFIVSNSIVWDEEFVDENDIFGYGAGTIFPAATLTAEYNGKTVELTAIDMKPLYNGEWTPETKPYGYNKEYIEAADYDKFVIGMTSSFLGEPAAIMNIRDNDLAELFDNLDPVSVVIYQTHKITQIVEEAGEKTYKPGNKIGTLTEVRPGEYELGNLRYGKYFLREVKAPEGFLLDDNYYEFDITTNGEVVNVTNAELFKNGIPAKHIDGKKLIGLFANEPIYAPVVITKTDIVDGKVLPGAGFRIKDADGNVVAEGYTDENGEFETYLRYGKYSFEEFDAPEGYEINTEIGYFEITEEGKIVKAKMEDERIADTDGYDLVEENKLSISPVMIGVILSMIVLFGAYILNNNSPKKRKENNN